METMTQLYYSGDIQKIYDFFQNYAGDDSLNAHIPARNLVMAHSIDSLAHQHSLFSAVGVAHLPGDKGIIHLLRNMGYTVEPVEASFTGLSAQLEKQFTEKYGYTVQQLSDGYSLDFPARPEFTKYPNSNMDIINYTDFSTKKTYVFMSTLVADIALDNHAIYEQMLDKLLSTMPVSHFDTSTVVMNGMQGLDIRLYVNNSTTLRYEIFIRNGKSFMVGLQGTPSEIDDAKSEEFIHSLHVFDVERSAIEYAYLPDSVSGFKVLMPEKFTYYASEQVQNEYDPIHTGFTQYLYSAQDPNLNASYVFTWFDLPRGSYYANDSVFYSTTNDLLKNSYHADPEKMHTTYIQKPLPGIKYDFISDNGTMVQFYTWLRGNRSYSAIYQVDTNHLQSEEFTASVNSFSLSPLPSPQLKEISVFNNSLQILFPSDTSDVMSRYYGFSIDSLHAVHAVDHYSASTFTCTEYMLNPLSWFPDMDSVMMFVRDMLVDHDDSVTEIVHDYKADFPTYEFIADHPTLSNFRKYKVIVNGANVYVLMCTAPEELKRDPELKKYFSTVQVIKPAAEPGILLRSKLKELIDALAGIDSVNAAAARRAINVVKPEPSDLPVIYQALHTNFPDENDSIVYYRTKSQIIDLLSDQKDDETLKQLTDYYRHTKYKKDKIHILSALVSIRTEASMDSFFVYGKEIDQQMDYLYPVFTDFYDSSDYFIQHFDRFMQLNPNSGLLDGVVSVLNYIVGSDSLSVQKFYLPYEKTFSQLFDQELEAYKNEKDEDAVSDYEWHLSDLAELFYRGFDANDHTNQFNALLDVAKTDYVKDKAVVGLIQAGIDPGKKVIVPILNDNYNNFLFMDDLSSIKKTSSVYKYLTPQDIARIQISEWLNYEDDYVDKIEFVESFSTGNDSVMYVFKVYYDYDEEWMYAGIGPYAPGEMHYERQPVYVDAYIEEYDKSQLKHVEKEILDAWLHPKNDY